MLRCRAVRTEGCNLTEIVHWVPEGPLSSILRGSNGASSCRSRIVSYRTLADVDDHERFCDVIHDVGSAPRSFEEHLVDYQHCRHNLDLRYHAKLTSSALRDPWLAGDGGKTLFTEGE